MAERCPFCGYQNDSDSEFCHFCNATLEKRPKHHAEPKPPAQLQSRVHPARYCTYCGGPITQGGDRCPKCGRSQDRRHEHHAVEEHREERVAEPKLGHYCAACRVWWPETMAFCQKCGATIDPKLIKKAASTESSMIVICPNCGTKNARREKFCCTCAASLESAKKRLTDDPYSQS